MHHINPAGTDGFAFLEFTTKEPLKLDTQFKALGFTSIAKHITYDITLYQQNDIYFIINLHQNTLIKQFTTARSSGTTAMGFKVKDAKLAYQHAIAQGALPYEPHIDELTYDIPAIYGVGNTLIYFVDLQNNQPNYLAHFVPMTSSQPKPSGSHLTYLDHVTHNLHRGNMDSLANFYERVFNFREIRYFDIEGKLTGLKSRAMTSPCGKIRIPLNESSDDKSQIEEFLKDFNGEGIQHIALGTDNIYNSVEILRDNTIQFLDTPDTYYELIQKRLPAHG